MDRFDLLYLAGVILIAIGAGGFYWQLAPAVIGAGLIALAIFGAKGGGNEGKHE